MNFPFDIRSKRDSWVFELKAFPHCTKGVGRKIIVHVWERERDGKNDLTNVSSSFACFVRISTRQKHFHTGFCQTERCLSADSGVGSRNDRNALGGVDVHDHHRTRSLALDNPFCDYDDRDDGGAHIRTTKTTPLTVAREQKARGSRRVGSCRVGSGRVTPPAVREPGDSTIFGQLFF